MYSERINKEDRINARVNAMRAHRKSVQRKKNIPVIATAVCTIALLAGGTVFGISMLNNHKTTDKTQAVQSTVAAKNAQSTQKAAQVRNAAAKTNNQTANASNTDYAQDNMPTYDESTNSYRTTTTAGAITATALMITAAITAAPYRPPTQAPTTAAQAGTVQAARSTSPRTARPQRATTGAMRAATVLSTSAATTPSTSLIGKEPGSGSITVWHNTDNNTQVPTTINFTVDDDLNVTYN